MATSMNSALVVGPARAEAVPALQKIWRELGPDSCPNSYNFHLHTTCSDGQLTPQALIEQAITFGLKGLAITDHHSLNGYQQARQWLLETYGTPPSLPQLWTGVEITAQLLDSEVHILGYGFDPGEPILGSYLQGKEPQGDRAQADRVIRAIHGAGGLAVLAHPQRYRQSAEVLIPAAAKAGIDGIEVYYAYRHVVPWRPTAKIVERVKELSDRYGLLHTCGTDTHGQDIRLRL